jgi:hypothetical protein
MACLPDDAAKTAMASGSFRERCSDMIEISMIFCGIYTVGAASEAGDYGAACDTA